MNLSTTVGENFASIYPGLNMEILHKGEFVPSRYGDTIELLAYKTGIENPIKRCVGGQRRDINIFFLLAEAMWIWAGRRDVKFLTIFNSRMCEFSDDGETFHAPYGFRLRNWGSNAERSLKSPDDKIFDQLSRAIDLFTTSDESRRVVLSIWNPIFDLFNEKSTKDTPCNDLLMFKIRNGKLHLTIDNRSNDLHWGLPTNVFQFSFILEMMARILGKDVGNQVHNSDSLHIYVNNDNNKIHEKMRDEYSATSGSIKTLYDYCDPSNMDFDFDPVHGSKLQQADAVVTTILDCLSSYADTGILSVLHLQSNYFKFVFHLLIIYITYTKTKRNDEARVQAIYQICHLQNMSPKLCNDYVLLALNFFHSRIKAEDSVQASMSEILMLRLNPTLAHIDYSIVGKL